MIRFAELRKQLRTITAWAVLMVATLLSWYFSENHGALEMANTGIMLVTFCKTYIVGRYFMELREAPALLHIAFAGWCVAICAALTVSIDVLPAP